MHSSVSIIGNGRLAWAIDVLEDRTVPSASPLATLEVPSGAAIGGNVDFTVVFENESDASTGFGSYVDLYLPATGADGVTGGNDGITFVGASVGTAALTPTIVTFGSNGVVDHPFAVTRSGAPVQIEGNPGDQLVVLPLPVATTPPGGSVSISVSAAIGADAVAGVPLQLRAGGGFALGNDELNNPDVDPSITNVVTSTRAKFTNLQGKSFSYTFVTDSQTFNKSTTAGVFTWQTSENAQTDLETFYSFCYDLLQNVSRGSTYDFDIISAEAGPFNGEGVSSVIGTERGDLLSEFWGRNFNSLFDNGTVITENAAAFQVGVWEIVHDTGLDVLSGNFSARAGSTNASFVALANTWLGQLDGTESDFVDLIGLGNPRNQDQITFAPESFQFESLATVTPFEDEYPCVLDVMAEHNVIVFDEARLTATDVEGSLLVGDDAFLNAVGIGARLADDTGGDHLVVGDDIEFNIGQVFFGDLVYGDEAIISEVGFPLGEARQDTVIDFVMLEAELSASSETLGGLPTNGTVLNDAGTLRLDGADADLNIFHLTAADLEAANTIVINAPAGASVVVNVSGQSVNISNLGMSINGTTREFVLFNLYEATTLEMSGISFQGSMLAVDAVVTFDNGNLEGALVAQSIYGNGQYNLAPPQFSICPNVPSYVMEHGGGSTSGGTAVPVTVSYNPVNTWEGGFQGEIVISNDSNQLLNGWELTFDFIPQVNEVWGASMSQEPDETYVLNNLAWNSVIAAGESVTIGFTASGDPSAMLQDVLVNGEPV
ncbi:Exoglucanase A precursor [Planctomycetes bacterium Pan216]|uniref:Exoglucanase A n=1 Tax=Kolteria novifilia TaxID=2527975 RepID=A0A518B0R6_9BACT|nr:Exoglucanase A precursor [Planctomycetes bacterium Pan216]